MRIAVLISGSGSNLQAIIDACAGGDIPGDICLVLSNKPGVGGLDRATSAGIDCAVINHRDYDSREDFDRALVATLAPYAPDLVILAGFMRILTPEFIGPFSGKLINIHPSLLPKYPGLHTHQRAIDAGDAWAGATVHFVTEELDGGPPILHARVPVESGDTAEALAARVLQQEHRIYPLAARWFCEGRLTLSARGAELDGDVLPTSGVDLESVAGQ